MNAKKLSFLSLIMVVLIASACGPSLAYQAATDTPLPTPTAAEGTPLTDVKYSARGVLDVTMPEGKDGPFPTVLLLPSALKSRWMYKEMAAYLTERGYAVVAADWGSPESRWLPEAFCALAWVHTSADRYGFDAERIAVFGHSEGGAAAATIGTIDDAGLFLKSCPHSLPQSGWTKGVVTYSGVYGTQGWALSDSFFQHWWQLGAHLTKDEIEPLFEALRSTPYRRWREIKDLDERATRAILSFPLAWVDGSEPPFRVIHGGKDQLWDVKDAEAFVFELQALGGDARLRVLAEAGQNDILQSGSAGFGGCLEAVEIYLAELLK